MKKILLILALFLFLFSYSSEWVNIGGKDYKIESIDTIQQIIICEGWYDISEEDGEYFPVFKGGKGSYFFYGGEKKNVNLSDEMIENLKEETQ